MDAELLKKATAAILGEGYVPPELAGEHAEAVLRVAIKACLEKVTHHILHRNAKDCRGDECGYVCPELVEIEAEIRALLTASEAAAPLPDAN